jgi:ABC-type multidrug transport system ATPase subunit
VRTGKRIVELQGVTKRGDRTLVKGLDLVLTPGERLGVVGPTARARPPCSR